MIKYLQRIIYTYQRIISTKPSLTHRHIVWSFLDPPSNIMLEFLYVHCLSFHCMMSDFIKKESAS